MLSYCSKCKQKKENVNKKLLKAKNGRTMLPSKYAVRSSKISKIYEITRSKKNIE